MKLGSENPGNAAYWLRLGFTMIEAEKNAREMRQLRAELGPDCEVDWE